jgi:hypothetical protein
MREGLALLLHYAQRGHKEFPSLLVRAVRAVPEGGMPGDLVLHEVSLLAEESFGCRVTRAAGGVSRRSLLKCVPLWVCGSDAPSVDMQNLVLEEVQHVTAPLVATLPGAANWLPPAAVQPGKSLGQLDPFRFPLLMLEAATHARPCCCACMQAGPSPWSSAGSRLASAWRNS